MSNSNHKSVRSCHHILQTSLLVYPIFFLYLPRSRPTSIRYCSDNTSTLGTHLAPLHTLHLPHLPLRAPKSINPFLLILPQPRFLRLSQNAFAQVVNKVSNHDQRECNRVHPVHPQMEYSNTDDHTPKVSRQKRDVLKSGAGKTVEDGNECVEDSQNERVADEIAADLPVPGSGVEGVAVEDGCLDAIDDHGPETELADDFVQWSATDEPLLVDVAETVEGCTEDSEEVAFELFAACDAADTGTVDGVRPEKHAHAADADDDTEDLCPVVADFEEEKGEEDDDDDGPEVD